MSATTKAAVLAQLTFVLGFYVGMFIVVAAVGDDAFNAAIPNPWRLLVSLPAWWGLAVYWRAVW